MKRILCTILCLSSFSALASAGEALWNGLKAANLPQAEWDEGVYYRVARGVGCELLNGVYTCDLSPADLSGRRSFSGPVAEAMFNAMQSLNTYKGPTSVTTEYIRCTNEFECVVAQIVK